MQNNKKIIVLVVQFIVSVTPLANGHEYARSELGTVRREIRKRFISPATRDVLLLAAQDRHLDTQFQKYLDEDPMMQKIEEIRSEGTSGDALSVISFVGDVKKDFADKGEELTDEWETAMQHKNMAQLVCVVGVVVGIAGVSMRTPLAGLAGGIMVTGGGYGWYVNGNKVDTIPTHLKTVHTMEEKVNRIIIVQQTNQKKSGKK